MTKELTGKKIAILATNGFEQVELTEPKKALEESGAQIHIIAPEGEKIQGWKHYDKADYVPVDVLLEDADPAVYDALILPGGTVNPDQLRVNDSAIKFIKAFFAADKIVAAICHGSWTLIEAEVVKGRKVTSWPSLKTDLINAGGIWVDQEVVVDQGLITSRNPDDIPAFNQKITELLAA
ncbi:MAG: type 1 glutamine amidotransferase domain-containing protein [Limnothrix sp.]